MPKCAHCGRRLPLLSFRKQTCQWCVQHAATQRGEVGEDAIQQVMPAPWARGGITRPVTQAIFGMNVAVFLGMVLAGSSILDPTTQQLIHWGANAGRLTLAGEWWRLVTSMFLHVGIVHIALNMWCLWSLGALAESLYGPWMFGAVYLISGVGGSLASDAWRPYGVSAGASGAIFGLAGALIASYRLGEFSAPSTVVSGTFRSILAFAGYSLVLGGFSSRTDNAAHIGGLVTGAFLGALIALATPHRGAIGVRIGIVAVGIAVVAGAGFWVEQAHGLEMRVDKANDLLRRNQPDQAIMELQKIVQRNPRLVSAHFGLAHAYFIMRRYPEAEAELKRVVNIAHDNGEAIYELGMTYLNENRLADAKTLFEGWIARAPKVVDAHYGLGVTLRNAGDCEAAIHEYNTALQLAPQAEGVYYEIGKCYNRLKQWDAAIESFTNEQKLNGDDEDIETGLAEAYTAKGLAIKANDAKHKAEQLAKNAGQESDD